MNDSPRSDRSGESDARTSRAAADELARTPLEELIEACHAEGHELNQPEFAVLARRLAEQPPLQERLRLVQATDARIAAAFRAVEVPPELAERIRAALAVATPPTAAADVSGSRPKARRIRWAAALVTTAAALLLTVSWWWRAPASYSADSIVDQAQRALADVDATEFEPGAPPKFALPSQLAQANIEGWRTGKFLERDATFLRLERNGIRATLIVAPLRGGPAINGKLPRELYTTGRMTFGVLPNSKQVYVLAVRGDASAYRQFLQQGAVAEARPSSPGLMARSERRARAR